MSLLYKILAVAALVAALIGGYAWWADHQQDIGYNRRVAEQTAADLQATKANFRTSELRAEAAANITKAKDEKIRRINDLLVTALDELRHRPERRSATADDSANCKGSTGADLSRPDAGFLAREAARADTLRAGLQACYAQYESLMAK
jgi:hypothetical protein